MTQPYQPGFHAIHANHVEDLRRAVVWICRSQPLAPLESETFLVQSNGMAQWLRLALASAPGEDQLEGGLGIAAGVEFLFPARFVWQLYRTVLPADEVAARSPYDKQRLIWHVYRLLPGLTSDESDFAPLKTFLAGADPDLRRFQLAEKIADLFDQYQVFRADWLDAWEQGRDELLLANGRQHEVDAANRWQPLLWRALVESMSEREARSSRAHIHNRFLQACQAVDPAHPPSGLPRRIFVFGVSSMPRQMLETLHVLSRFSQVVICVHNPCQYYWADIVSDRELLRAERKRGRAHPVLSTVSEPEELHQHANPLLAAWGKQGRDYIRLLDEFDNPEAYRARFQAADQTIDIFTDHREGNTPNLLNQLQDDILHLTSLAEAREQARQIDPVGDRSLVFHRAHGAQREVEILHDQLLAAFNQWPSLRPRDVIVMVPDIDEYAPHIRAVFGQHRSGSTRHIPFSIADQGQRHQTPLTVALEVLLSLPEHRFATSELFGLLEVPSLREQFGISEHDIPQLHRWVDTANIRWGLNPQQRASLDLPEQLRENTWLSGLRAILLGYGLGGGETWAGVEPLGEVGGIQASLAGQLARFIAELEYFWRVLRKPQSIHDWASHINAMLATFFGSATGQDYILINRLRGGLESLLEDLDTAGLGEEPIALRILRDLLLDRLDEGGLNQRFFAGKVNFATLMPMRAIPFRRVCLLGMNDGDYPRSRPPVDFDLMAKDYRPGDRSRREDDRYLFLEAMLSAREQLYISWAGNDAKDDSDCPPSVLVAQLCDHIDAIWKPADAPDSAPSDRLTTRHPLQAFSRRYFPSDNASGGEQPRPVEQVLARGNLFTYEREWRGVHADEAVAKEAREPLPLPEEIEPLSIAQLARMLKKPAESFYTERLQVRFEDTAGEDADNEPFSLNGLKSRALHNELVDQVILKAADEAHREELTEALFARMVRRGDLGIASTQMTLTAQLGKKLEDLYSLYRQEAESWPNIETRPHKLHLQHQVQGLTVSLQDHLDGLRSNREGQWCRLVVARSKLGPVNKNVSGVRYSNLMGDWVAHIAGHAAGLSFQTRIIGRDTVNLVCLPALTQQAAAEHLQTLLEAWVDNLCAPLPLEVEAGFAWLKTMHPKTNKEPDEQLAWRKAESALDDSFGFDKGYLRAAWPNLQAMRDSGRFTDLINQLYLPLMQFKREGDALEKEKNKKARGKGVAA